MRARRFFEGFQPAFRARLWARRLAVAVHLEIVDVVGDAVEQRAGEALRSERFGPFVKRKIAGDQGGTPFVALGDQLEQPFRAGFGERDEAQLISLT